VEILERLESQSDISPPTPQTCFLVLVNAETEIKRRCPLNSVLHLTVQNLRHG